MSSESASAAGRLCAACGMCCDGVLFHSVKLQAGDSARALSAAGLKIKHRTAGVYFHQPCPAHNSCSCTIYDRRPTRCREFNCQQIIRVSAEETSEETALQMIGEARELVASVNALIDQLAATNPNRALAQRCANALTASERTPLHEKLATAMQKLETLLAKEFRIE